MDLRFFRAAALAAICMTVGTTAATPRDSAVIVNSGSTNTAGFRIEVSPDGSASVALTSRAGQTSSAVKAFTAPPASVKQFFADLDAARKGNAITVPCMKSASFGTSTHISWQGWTSPDLDCPPKDALGEALIRDVKMMRDAAGVGQPPLLH